MRGLADQAEQVRRAAAEAWRQAELSTTPLIDLVETAPLPTREAALIALGSASGDGREAAERIVAPILVDATEDRDAGVALAGAIHDDDEWMRAPAIRCITDRVSSRWSEVADMASDPSPIVRRTAAPLSAMMKEHMSDSLDLVGPAERVIALRRVPLFSSLEPADLHRIAGAATERTYPRRERLFSEGEPGTDMCVVLDGSLEVTRQTDVGIETFNTYGPGDHAGELAVLRHAPRTADVTATTDVRVLVIDGDTVDSILVERPEVARTMLATLADRLAVLSQQTPTPHTP